MYEIKQTMTDSTMRDGTRHAWSWASVFEHGCPSVGRSVVEDRGDKLITEQRSSAQWLITFRQAVILPSIRLEIPPAQPHRIDTFKEDCNSFLCEQWKGSKMRGRKSVTDRVE